jgi:alpha-acetolactate decarboxylase
MRSGDVGIDITDGLFIQFPATEEFLNADLTGDTTKELIQVEN